MRNFSPAIKRIAPFALFMTFIAIEQGLHYLVTQGAVSIDSTSLLWLYLPKAAATGLLLLYFWRDYTELSLRDITDIRNTVLSIASGLLIFVLWVNMDWSIASSDPQGFNPYALNTALQQTLIICLRIAGAVLVVPIMEELFWRSFLLRYLIDSDFLKVDIRLMRPLPFIVVAVLFGTEHHFIFAGIMAGVIFNLLYYYTRSIMQCILSHAVANLGLAAYILTTTDWRFW